MPSSTRALAESIAGAEASEARRAFLEACAARGLTPADEAVDLATLLQCAYPATVR